MLTAIPSPASPRRPRSAYLYCHIPRVQGCRRSTPRVGEPPSHVGHPATRKHARHEDLFSLQHHYPRNRASHGAGSH